MFKFGLEQHKLYVYSFDMDLIIFMRNIQVNKFEFTIFPISFLIKILLLYFMNAR